MIIAISTSSPVCSVAAFDESGKLLTSAHQESQMQASVVCFDLLKKLDIDVAKATGFLADLGPGSFTGIRIGVTIAKTFGWIYGTQVAGLAAWKLMPPADVVLIPSRKREWFHFAQDGSQVRSSEIPTGAVGYGVGVEDQVFPLASQFSQRWSELSFINPSLLLPEYVLEPSISTPKPR